MIDLFNSGVKINLYRHKPRLPVESKFIVLNWNLKTLKTRDSSEEIYDILLVTNYHQMLLSYVRPVDILDA